MADKVWKQQEEAFEKEQRQNFATFVQIGHQQSSEKRFEACHKLLLKTPLNLSSDGATISASSLLAALAIPAFYYYMGSLANVATLNSQTLSLNAAEAAGAAVANGAEELVMASNTWWSAAVRTVFPTEGIKAIAGTLKAGSQAYTEAPTLVEGLGSFAGYTESPMFGELYRLISTVQREFGFCDRENSLLCFMIKTIQTVNPTDPSQVAEAVLKCVYGWAHLTSRALVALTDTRLGHAAIGIMAVKDSLTSHQNLSTVVNFSAAVSAIKVTDMDEGGNALMLLQFFNSTPAILQCVIDGVKRMLQWSKMAKVPQTKVGEMEMYRLHSSLQSVIEMRIEAYIVASKACILPINNLTDNLIDVNGSTISLTVIRGLKAGDTDLATLMMKQKEWVASILETCGTASSGNKKVADFYNPIISQRNATSALPSNANIRMPEEERTTSLQKFQESTQREEHVNTLDTLEEIVRSAINQTDMEIAGFVIENILKPWSRDIEYTVNVEFQSVDEQDEQEKYVSTLVAHKRFQIQVPNLDNTGSSSTSLIPWQQVQKIMWTAVGAAAVVPVYTARLLKFTAKKTVSALGTGHSPGWESYGPSQQDVRDQVEIGIGLFKPALYAGDIHHQITWEKVTQGGSAMQIVEQPAVEMLHTVSKLAFCLRKALLLAAFTPISGISLTYIGILQALGYTAYAVTTLAQGTEVSALDSADDVALAEGFHSSPSIPNKEEGLDPDPIQAAAPYGLYTPALPALPAQAPPALPALPAQAPPPPALPAQAPPATLGKREAKAVGQSTSLAGTPSSKKSRTSWGRLEAPPKAAASQAAAQPYASAALRLVYDQSIGRVRERWVRQCMEEARKSSKEQLKHYEQQGLNPRVYCESDTYYRFAQLIKLAIYNYILSTYVVLYRAGWMKSTEVAIGWIISGVRYILTGMYMSGSLASLALQTGSGLTGWVASLFAGSGAVAVGSITAAFSGVLYMAVSPVVKALKVAQFAAGKVDGAIGISKIITVLSNALSTVRIAHTLRTMRQGGVPKHVEEAVKQIENKMQTIQGDASNEYVEQMKALRKDTMATMMSSKQDAKDGAFEEIQESVDETHKAPAEEHTAPPEEQQHKEGKQIESLRKDSAKDGAFSFEEIGSVAETHIAPAEEHKAPPEEQHKEHKEGAISGEAFDFKELYKGSESSAAENAHNLMLAVKSYNIVPYM